MRRRACLRGDVAELKTTANCESSELSGSVATERSMLQLKHARGKGSGALKALGKRAPCAGAEREYFKSNTEADGGYSRPMRCRLVRVATVRTLVMYRTCDGLMHLLEMSSVFLIETRGFRGLSGSDRLSCPPPAEEPDWLDPCSEASLARL